MSLNDFAIIESTLREGEQFVGADFSTDDKVETVSYTHLTLPTSDLV